VELPRLALKRVNKRIKKRRKKWKEEGGEMKEER